MLRAGFTDVLSTGMLMRWMRVSTRPMETPAKPAENLRWKMAAIVTVRNAVMTISVMITDARLYPPGEWLPPVVPKPFVAKLFVALKVLTPFAMSQRMKAPMMPPRTWPTM